MTTYSLQSCEERLENLQKEYEEFAYIVSHDLKAPLRAINNLSGWVQEDLGENIDADVAHNIRLLQNRVERMERMINAILLFSRVNRTDMTITEVDTQSLVKDIVKFYEQEKGNPIQLHTHHLPVLKTYSAKLRTVFESIIGNAVQYNDKPTLTLEIESKQTEDFYSFSIRDNGPGIATEALDKIFNLFYTALPKDQHENVGAGLTICRKIVQFVGGTITANPIVEEGLEINFTWPSKTE